MHTEKKQQAIVYLDRNESQFGPAPECFEILRQATRIELSNYSRDFARGVKSVLSETLAHEYDIFEPNVLLSYGSEDMLKQIVHCYLAKDETMLIPQHSWWYYKSVASEVSGKVVEYPMHSDDLHFYYDIEEIIALTRSVKPRLLLFASPNNPTGNSLSVEDVKRLVEECGETMFIIDEAYFGFTETVSEIMPQLTLRHANLAVLRTFSKLYGLAGIRIGYTFVGKNYQRLVTFSARYLGYNQLSEQLAMAALSNRKYYQSLAATIATERDRYYRTFRAMEGCQAYHSDANFVLVRLLHEDCDPLKEHLAAAGLVIKFFSEGEFPDHVRITIGTPEQNSLLLGELQKYFTQTRTLIPEQR